MGYKLQVTETAGEASRFISDVEVVPAMCQDSQCPTAIQDRLVRRGIPPGKQHVDQAYMSGRHIAESLARGIDLRGYVREGNTSKPEGFRLRDFQIDIGRRRAICPAGKKQVTWVRAAKTIPSSHVYIRHLRTMIEPDPDHPGYILTHRGTGYCLAKV